MKKQMENANSDSLVLDGQLSLDDLMNNVDDGTYGKPVEEYVVESNAE